MKKSEGVDRLSSENVLRCAREKRGHVAERPAGRGALGENGRKSQKVVNELIRGKNELN